MNHNPFQVKHVQTLNIKSEHNPRIEIESELLVIRATLDQVETVITVPVESLIGSQERKPLASLETRPKIQPRRLRHTFVTSGGKNRRGELNGMAKLNEKQVKEIRQILSDTSIFGKDCSRNKAYEELAKVYKVTKSCIMLIDTNRTWRHVTV